MSTPRGNLGEREQTKAPENWAAEAEADVDAVENGDIEAVTVLTVVVGYSVMELPVTVSVDDAARMIADADPDELVGFTRHETVGGVGYVRAGKVIVIDSKLMLTPHEPYTDPVG